MKKSLAIALLIICTCFFVFGYWSGQNLNGFLDGLLDPGSTKALANSNELPNHQKNILVVEVDRLETAKPRLISVWLMLYIKNTPKITWMPLYLASSDNKGDSSFRNIITDKKFILGENKTLPTQFESSLRKNDIWWHGYIITDQQGINRLTELLKSSPHTTISNSELDVEAINAVSLLPKSAMQEVNKIENICNLSSYLENPMVIKTWFDDGQNLTTDLPTEELVTQWIALIGKQTNLTCEFPSLFTIP